MQCSPQARVKTYILVGCVLGGGYGHIKASLPTSKKHQNMGPICLMYAGENAAPCI